MIKLLFISAIMFAIPKTGNQQPAKLYTVSMSLQQWQATASAISNSELPAKVANQISNEIVTQLNKQLAADTVKRKK